MLLQSPPKMGVMITDLKEISLNLLKMLIKIHFCKRAHLGGPVEVIGQWGMLLDGRSS